MDWQKFGNWSGQVGRWMSADDQWCPKLTHRNHVAQWHCDNEIIRNQCWAHVTLLKLVDSRESQHKINQRRQKKKPDVMKMWDLLLI